VPHSALAKLNGDPVKGKHLFMTTGDSGRACMSCHPMGLTTKEIVRGKQVPNLTERASQISEKRLIAKALKYMEENADLELTDAQFIDLITFVSQLPTKGFGEVPPEWQGYVKNKLKQ
jgi:cytochrome c553